MVDVLEIGAKILAKNLPGNVSLDTAVAALGGLLGDGKGGLDLSSVISKMGGGDLAGIASSWLGSGGNDAIGPEQLLKVFGGNKISAFASQLGTDQQSALTGLSKALPEIMDKASPEGDLLGALGGAGGIGNLAKGFLK